MDITTLPVNLENLFSGFETRYVVPDYQRDYSWSSDQVEELWTDIVTSESAQAEYFMGAIVLNEQESEDCFEIVDGQQRLTTFTLLFSVIASVARAFESNSKVFPNCERTKENVSRSKKIEKMAMDRLLYTSEPDNYYLTINRKDNELFGIVIRDTETVLLSDAELKIVSNESRIKKTRKIFFKAVVDQFGSSAIAIDRLHDTLVHFIKKLKFIKIIVASDTDAFLLFESLNSKGMDLSTADLVKNKLLMIGSSSVSQEVKAGVLSNWDKMISNITSRSRISPVDYLRTYWMSFPGKNTTKKELYKNIKTHLSGNPDGVLEFARDLAEKSEIFSLITDKSLIWPDSRHKPNELLQIMGEINTLKYTLCHPAVLFASVNRAEDAPIIAKYSLAFLFRWITVSDRSVGTAFGIFSEVLKALKEEKELPQVLSPLLSKIDSIGDEEFKSIFKALRVQDSTVAKYILGKIHAYESNSELLPVFNELHLEHVLPQDVTKWKEKGDFSLISGTTYDDWIYHVGNLTLLSKSDNMSLQNSVFSEKTVLFKKSNFSMTSAIAIRHDLDGRNWSPEWISERAELWSGIVPKIWRIDYLS